MRKVLYLASSRKDIMWLRHYYNHVFPAGGKKARERIIAAERLIAQNPAIGHMVEIEGLREFSIPGTPFSMLYRATPSHIEIVRLWDARGDRSMI
jgi:plasmid stabilization system protein ParE